MGKTADNDEDARDQPVNDAVVVVGEPNSLRGELHLHNPGAEKIVLREARVRKGLQPSAEIGAKKADFPPTKVSLQANIQPGQSQRVTFNLDLDSRTPAGEYHGELEVGGSTRPLLMHVTESVRLAISPKQLVIDRRAGAKIIKRVIFSNDGNVPLTVGEIGSVMLGEELLLTRGLRASIGAINDKRGALEKLFVEILSEEAKALTVEVGSLMVRNLAAPLVLQPGDVHAVDLEITLPKELKTNSRYRARLPLYTADLEFVIVPVSDKPGIAGVA